MRCIAAFALLLFCCGAAVAGPAADLYTKPGRLVAVDGHRLNLICTGSGAPVVVLDAGLGDWSPSWLPVQVRLASLTTVCAYDRAGYGFSDATSAPRTSMEIAAELHALLHAASLPAPYVLVGHSFGGLNQQAFVARYRADVAGLVLVDSTPDDLAQPVFLQPMLDAQGQALRKCAAAARAHAVAIGAPVFDNCFDMMWGVRSLPNNGVTPALLATVKRQALRPGPYDAQYGELMRVAQSQNGVRRATRSYGALPTIVLTATTHGGSAVPAALRAPLSNYESMWRAAQDRIAARSTCVRHELVPSGHYIQFYRPQRVIDAIARVVSAVRAGTTRCSL
jgi:pimeloyl-ACP methyl ester carboxylesterase